MLLGTSNFFRHNNGTAIERAQYYMIETIETTRLNIFSQDFCVNLVQSRGFICGHPHNIE